MSAAESRYFADERNGYYADRDGFHDPEKAAEHARDIQGGFSTALVEAERMIKDGGVARERATAWLAAHGYLVTAEDYEPCGTKCALCSANPGCFLPWIHFGDSKHKCSACMEEYW